MKQQPLDAHELAALKARAERQQHGRGAQGLWCRRWLALYATLEVEREDLYDKADSKFAAQMRE